MIDVRGRDSCGVVALRREDLLGRYAYTMALLFLSLYHKS